MFTHTMYCCWRCGSRRFHAEVFGSGTYRVCVRCGRREVEDCLLMALFNTTTVLAAVARITGGN